MSISAALCDLPRRGARAEPHPRGRRDVRHGQRCARRCARGCRRRLRREPRVPGLENGLWAAGGAVSGKGCGDSREEVPGQENHHQGDCGPDRCQRPASRMDPSWKRDPLRFQPFTSDGTEQEAR